MYCSLKDYIIKRIVSLNRNKVCIIKYSFKILSGTEVNIDLLRIKETGNRLSINKIYYRIL
jgi:hypothetical protein